MRGIARIRFGRIWRKRMDIRGVWFEYAEEVLRGGELIWRKNMFLRS